MPNTGSPVTRAGRAWRVLVVVAVDAERRAVLAGLDRVPVAVVSAGVGVAAAAAVTARELALADVAGRRFTAVISAGIAGGFAGRADVGTTVVASRSVAADLGAQSPDGFLALDQLGFGPSTWPGEAGLVGWLHDRLPGAVVGEVLTVSTVTGLADRAAELAVAHPEAVAEAMEGTGVATATQLWPGTGFAELRIISNLVGPRDRAAWRLTQALAGLTDAFRLLGPDLPGPTLPGPTLPGPTLLGPDLPGPDLPGRR